jgi:hypothetical protein
MHYIALDVANLSKWLRGDPPYEGGSGTRALGANGYSVYFSDRRNNRNDAGQETGEYGFEDVVNPESPAGAPNGAVDAGENVDASTDAVPATYGMRPSYEGTLDAVPPCTAANACASPGALDGNARPWDAISAAEAKVNRALFFRRALKLVNGSTGIVAPGLTIFSENPVYVEGDWNATQAQGFAAPHVATAIIADAVTLLSSAWTDNVSFSAPYAQAGRVRSPQSYYRFAAMAGKNAPFPRADVVGAFADDFGTDGGVHNFLRMLEGGGGTVNYRGSMASFYYSRQAVGVYKFGGNTVYGAPERRFAFDTDFLQPSKLPPLTPMFRDLNPLGFRQEVRPGR